LASGLGFEPSSPASKAGDLPASRSRNWDRLLSNFILHFGYLLDKGP
jgi:hypothetical protein